MLVAKAPFFLRLLHAEVETMLALAAMAVAEPGTVFLTPESKCLDFVWFKGLGFYTLGTLRLLGV